MEWKTVRSQGLSGVNRILGPQEISFTETERSFVRWVTERMRRTTDKRTLYRSSRPLDCLSLTDASVNGRTGIVFDRADRLIFEDSCFDRDRLAKSMELFGRRSKKEISINTNPVFSAIHLPWANANVYHWVVDCLPRFYALFEGLRNEKFYVLIPSKSSPFVLLTLFSLLRSCSQAEVVFVDSDVDVLAERLIVPSYTSNHMCGFIPREQVRFVQDLLLDYVDSNVALETRPSEILFVSRADAVKRKILNEDQLIDELKKVASVKVIQATRYAYWKQLSFFREARVVVGPHGAGLTNFLFSSSSAVLFELFAASLVKLHYFYMVKGMERDYYPFVSESSQDANGNFVMSKRDISLVVDSVREVIRGDDDKSVRCSLMAGPLDRECE